MQFKTASGAVIAALSLSGVASAEIVGVVGGQTSVLLDLELIGSVTDLDILCFGVCVEAAVFDGVRCLLCCVGCRR